MVDMRLIYRAVLGHPVGKSVLEGKQHPPPGSTWLGNFVLPPGFEELVNQIVAEQAHQQEQVGGGAAGAGQPRATAGLDTHLGLCRAKRKRESEADPVQQAGPGTFSAPAGSGAEVAADAEPSQQHSSQGAEQDAGGATASGEQDGAQGQRDLGRPRQRRRLGEAQTAGTSAEAAIGQLHVHVQHARAEQGLGPTSSPVSRKAAQSQEPEAGAAPAQVSQQPHLPAAPPTPKLPQAAGSPSQAGRAKRRAVGEQGQSQAQQQQAAAMHSQPQPQPKTCPRPCGPYLTSGAGVKKLATKAA